MSKAKNTLHHQKTKCTVPLKMQQFRSKLGKLGNLKQMKAISPNRKPARKLILLPQDSDQRHFRISCIRVPVQQCRPRSSDSTRCRITISPLQCGVCSVQMFKCHSHSGPTAVILASYHWYDLSYHQVNSFSEQATVNSLPNLHSYPDDKEVDFCCLVFFPRNMKISHLVGVVCDPFPCG